VAPLDAPAEKAQVKRGWLLITAAGSTWHSQIWQIEAAEQLETMNAVAWATEGQVPGLVEASITR
jgi:hypothetical protein